MTRIAVLLFNWFGCVVVAAVLTIYSTSVLIGRMKSFGYRLRELRRAKDISQRELAEKVGVDFSEVRGLDIAPAKIDVGQSHFIDASAAATGLETKITLLVRLGVTDGRRAETAWPLCEPAI